MNRLAALAALLLLALAGIFLALRREDARTPDRGGATLTPNAPGRVVDRARNGDLATPSLGPASPGAAPAAGARTLASTDHQAELARSSWIDGRVVFPENTPPEEMSGGRVRVLAEGRAFEHGPTHSVAVDADGRFRVAFAPGTRTGYLNLEAEHLYLEERVRVDVDADAVAGAGSREPLELRPILGGALRGRVVPPADVPGAGERMVGRAVRLTVSRQVGARSFRTTRGEAAKLGPSLDFEFTGLSPEARCVVSFDAGFLVPVEVEDLVPRPGVTDEIVLEPRRGATLAGVVVDEAGDPIPLANVEAESDDGLVREGLTKEGAFRLEGVAPGETVLTAEAIGYETGRLELGEVLAGQVSEGLRIVLATGRSISGIVLLPDGTPADGATVTVEGQTRHDTVRVGVLAGNAQRTDENGAFTISGLVPDTYRVEAAFVRKERVTVVSELTGRERERTVQTTLRAVAEDVAVGTTGLVLAVDAGQTLRGTVVDDLGAPVDRFEVRYGRLVESNSSRWTRDRKELKFRDAGGAFEVDGLQPGEYRLHVESDEHLPSAPVDIEIPGADLAPIVVQRAARIAGRVYTPAGEPVRNAVLEVALPPFEAGLSNPPGPSFDWRGKTDGGGRFELERIPPGDVMLRANAAGFGPSPARILAVAAGQALDDLELQLSAGARLTGSVVDAEGDGLAQRTVSVERVGESGAVTARTDAAGGFEVQGLEPGEFEVTCPPSSGELTALGFAGIDGADKLLMRRETVEVGPNGAHVVLRPPEVTSIRLHGRVTVNGEPREGGVYVRPVEKRGVDGSGQYTRIGADGRFAVAVAGRGTYRLDVALDSNLSTSAEARLERSDEHVDVEIRAGSIEGRVLGPDGPVGKGLVQAVRRHASDGTEAWSRSRAGIDADGRFELDDLPEGTWTVSYSSLGETLLGEAQESGLIVTAGRTLRGVELRPPLAGRLVVAVLDGRGDPLRGARVTISGPDGRGTTSTRVTGATHRAEFSSLEPGAYRVIANGDDAVTPDAIEVAVAGGRSVERELRVEPGTLLLVRVLSSTPGTIDDRVHARVRRDGADWPADRVDLEPDGGGQVLRLGPVPRGTYEISVETSGGKAPAQTVRVRGEERIEVTFQLE